MVLLQSRVILGVLLCIPFAGVGCGSASPATLSANMTTLTATVSLPASSAPSLSVKRERATGESFREGKACRFWDGDTLLGVCTTESDGTCSIPAALSAGEHTIFTQVLDDDDAVILGSLKQVTLSDSAASVNTTVDAAEDLSYQAFKAACSKAAGEDCVPGINVSQGMTKVSPDCIHGAIATALNAEITDETVSTHLKIVLELQKSNFQDGSPEVDFSCVWTGDSSCLQEASTLLGPSESEAASSALSTASMALDLIVDTLCGDPATYDVLKQDPVSGGSPEIFLTPIATLKPSEMTAVKAQDLKAVITAAPASLSQGLGFLAEPGNARMMAELALNGQITSSLDRSEVSKRIALMEGGGSAANFDEAAVRARAAANVYAATTWADINSKSAREFGAIFKDYAQTIDIIVGGKSQVDQIFDKVGGAQGVSLFFESHGTGSDASAQFAAATKLRNIGESCTANADCSLGGLCAGSGLGGTCMVAGATAAFSGGPGWSCKADSDCAQSKGFGCDGPAHVCVLLAVQASGNFAVGGKGFAPLQEGAFGTSCSQDGDCREGRVCLKKLCLDRPAGIVGASAAGLSCTAHDQCALGYCTSGRCAEAGGVSVNTPATGSSRGTNVVSPPLSPPLSPPIIPPVETVATAKVCGCGGDCTDTDGDGLPDTWEAVGVDRDCNGAVDLNLATLGADARHRDLFVEVDYMVASDHSHKPDDEALSKMAASFNNAPVSNPDGQSGIRLHFTLKAIPHYNVVSFGPAAGCEGDDFILLDDLKKNHFETVKRVAFHYAVFAHLHTCVDDASSGRASSVGNQGATGNDLIVAMDAIGSNPTVMQQGGTLMHELGHNLGLRHGGNSAQAETNKKSNYLSVMNVRFQFIGIPYVGQSGNVLDYSREQLPSLDEASLSETAGIGNSGAKTLWQCPAGSPAPLVRMSDGTGPIDWNCNGQINDGSVNVDLNADGIRGALTGHNDWASLKYQAAGAVYGIQSADDPNVLPISCYGVTIPGSAVCTGR